ncbi:Crp/Fnr family transcriptional regulator [Tenacibaculum sp. 190524A02b]|uniref:Crp/Fnr family transcriptional regulator n=1 Tax=Tenacibaculum vairaonense TaxID=3137860 RepID=A0ABM9PHN6_9FLAO
MEIFRNVVNSIHPLSDEVFNEYVSLSTFKKLPKNYKIAEVNKISTSYCILISGAVSAFLTDENGKEHIRTLYTPITTAGNLSSLIQKTPSKLTYECLTDCDVLEFKYDDVYQLSLKRHEFAIFHYKTLEMIYAREAYKIIELSSLDATQRYQKLLQQSPNINQLVNQYHIASYLNITSVQLSRIKKNLL